jgi:hypothetical protein
MLRATHGSVCGVKVPIIACEAANQPFLKLTNMKTLIVAIVTLLLAWSYAVPGVAAQHAVQTPFGEKIVHTRRIPVLMHKAVPPYAGKHVYQGRLR